MKNNLQISPRFVTLCVMAEMSRTAELSLVCEPEECLKLQMDDRSVSAKFRELAKKWKRERLPSSFVAVLINHPAYREIVSLGRDVVPVILDEMRTDPDFWFPALREITGENPVPPERRGQLKEMAETWIHWGSSRGYVRT